MMKLANGATPLLVVRRDSDGAYFVLARYSIQFVTWRLETDRGKPTGEAAHGNYHGTRLNEAMLDLVERAGPKMTLVESVF